MGFFEGMAQGDEESGWQVGSLTCPGCGEGYSHIRSVVPRPEEDEYGTDIDIVIEVEGECGHDWTITFTHHEGITTVESTFRDSVED